MGEEEPVTRDRYRRKHCDRIRGEGGGLKQAWYYSNGT